MQSPIYHTGALRRGLHVLTNPPSVRSLGTWLLWMAESSCQRLRATEGAQVEIQATVAVPLLASSHYHLCGPILQFFADLQECNPVGRFHKILTFLYRMLHYRRTGFRLWSTSKELHGLQCLCWGTSFHLTPFLGEIREGHDFQANADECPSLAHTPSVDKH